jgi:hypothetical protein
MQTNFAKRTYTTVFQDIGPIAATLVAGAAVAAIVTLDVTPLSRVSITVGVSIADLSAFEIWVRTDRVGAPWLQLALDQAKKWGRSDAGIDLAKTPAGASCFVSLETQDWCDVEIRVASSGASVLSITAGGK